MRRSIARETIPFWLSGQRLIDVATCLPERRGKIFLVVVTDDESRDSAMIANRPTAPNVEDRYGIQVQ